MTKQIMILAGCAWLSGCTAIGNWADQLGSHMPVIGERCNHWECFSSSGQMQSSYNEQMQERQKDEPKDPNAYPQYDYPTAPAY